jgi:hypothetical protein
LQARKVVDFSKFAFVANWRYGLYTIGVMAVFGLKVEA